VLRIWRCVLGLDAQKVIEAIETPEQGDEVVVAHVRPSRWR
jgi:hypothetical protein